MQGVRVIEFCEVASGPFCGMLLADFGADVIKVEKSDGGDALRQWPPLNHGDSENFASLNRNKRSIALDLKDPAQRDIARRLCLSADVVLENYRPGAMARNGLGYADLSPEKPSLVMASISAYGQEGPRANEGGFDVVIQAVGGIMSVTGEADSDPVKCGVPVSDFSAGLYAAFAIVTALRHAEATGQGAHLDIPMLGTTLAIAALQTSEYFGTGKSPRKLGSAHPRNAPYQAFRAQDGFFVLAAGNDKLWRSVCEMVALPELVGDSRFIDTTSRCTNQAALKHLLESVFRMRTSAHWIEQCAMRGIPCGPINDYATALADSQVAATELVQDLDLPNGARTKTVVSPLRFGETQFGVRRRPPALDEHRTEILSELP
ncbi:CoA transferase [Rhodospirillales bacterium TMPK1]|uniref:CoA transferase n=1 Tax=Roseiterribacter gracilis TaxID=2812848 RepID=A0A8S8X814_9PROT|nr:CoA transferase [Rhodospirillales bacterium TMPK1]